MSGTSAATIPMTWKWTRYSKDVIGWTVGRVETVPGRPSESYP